MVKMRPMRKILKRRTTCAVTCNSRLTGMASATAMTEVANEPVRRRNLR